MSLSLFIENMNTECSLLGNPVIPIAAIKVDGEGDGSLKYLLCENRLKSCDYVKFTNNNICFIEFSDFYEQLSALKVMTAPLLSSSITPDELQALRKNKLVIKPENVIKNEVQTKISETLHLFQLMCAKYPIAEHIAKNKIFIIALCKIVISDIILFDTLLREIKRKFNSIIDIEMFLYTDLENYLTVKVT